MSVSQIFICTDSIPEYVLGERVRGSYNIRDEIFGTGKKSMTAEVDPVSHLKNEVKRVSASRPHLAKELGRIADIAYKDPSHVDGALTLVGMYDQTPEPLAEQVAHIALVRSQGATVPEQGQ